MLNWKFWKRKPLPVAAVREESKRTGRPLALAIALAMSKGAKGEAVKDYKYPIQAPMLAPGVVPTGQTPAVAMDSAFAAGVYEYASQAYCGFAGFPGYPYLAQLSTRAEYRAFAASLSTEMTREWIVLNSSDTAGESTQGRITELTQKMRDIGLQKVMQAAFEHDCLYGRGQVFIKLKGDEKSRDTPLILDPKTIKRDSFDSIGTVEPMWTTPSTYNANDPLAADFYKPTKWFVMGNQVHSSRLLTIITRPLPDMLKPAFNFGGMSLSQLMEPAVDNWLRTRRSVSDLLSNFSITALATAMGQNLTADCTDDDAQSLIDRAQLFTLNRDNQGLMLLDKETEELVQVNTPLSGLHELQAQAQEGQCSGSRVPSTVLLGTAPSGFGNVAEGEIRTFYDWISSLQESHMRVIIETILKVLQLSIYGDIDPDIFVTFQPLYQMTPKELAEIRLSDSQAAVNYIDRGVIAPQEDRERLARDPISGYQGLDVNVEVELPEEPTDEGDEA